MVIRKALNGDSEALIELTRLAPMKGRISLRIDRKPDFFSLLKERGDYTCDFLKHAENYFSVFHHDLTAANPV